jgi:hypothetical protein
MQNSFKSENEVTRYNVMQSKQEHTHTHTHTHTHRHTETPQHTTYFENFQDFLGVIKVLRNKLMANLSLKNETIITLPNLKTTHPQHSITAQKTGIRVTTFHTAGHSINVRSTPA